MKVCIPWLVLLLGVSLAPKVCAKFITMDATVSSTIHAADLTIEVQLTNRGDEPAHEVTVAALLQGDGKSSSTISRLEPSAARTVTLRSAIPRGFVRSIVPLVIYYKDGKGHQFSVLSYAVAKYSRQESFNVLAKIEPIKLARRETLIIKAKSVDERAHHIGIKVIVPDELSITPKTQTVDVPPDGEVRAVFKLSNFDAMPNSTYTILAILSENREKGIYEDVVVGMVSIAAPQSIRERLKGSTVLWVLGFMIFCYVLYQLIVRRQRKSG